MYLGGNGGDDINKYTLPTAWDVSTIISCNQLFN